MPVPPGTRFGHFEIHSALGAGGMGEVYRARDTRLDRDVAIKILPEGFAADATARDRFQREAKSIAALNDPHICTLHDIGQDGNTAFLVMELVEGDTLSALIAKGPVPLATALAIAGQIADALDKAHKAGIAHRDLKPANVMLTKQAGAIHVKLLDFGLAKPAGLHVASGASQAAATMTANPSLTAAGSIVGTLHYMAPEQLEGRDADPRSDIWAFGCVLYEMLTGTRPFDAKSSVGLMAAILEHEPAPLATRQPLTPPALEHIITRCLTKDPEARWQSARDLAVELRWIAQGGAHETSKSTIAVSWSSRGAKWAVASLIALAAALLGAAAGARWFTGSSIAADRVAFDIEAPSLQPDSIAVSPDGRFIVYSGTADGTSHLILREISSTAARILPGTQNGAGPFWSPDSRSVGFFTATELRRVDLTGGDSIRIALLPVASGPGSQGSWSESGLILFSQVNGTGIRSVSDQGGPLVEVTTLRAEKFDRTHLYPCFLPGGRAFLYLRVSGPDFTGNSEVVHHALDTGEERVVLKAYSRIEFADPDWLIYTQGQEPTLVAQRFNVADGKLVGGFRTLVSGILRINPQSRRPISASARLLAYRTGQYAPSMLTWFNRRGEPGPIASPTTQVENASSSLDGSLIVSNGTSSQNIDVWLTDTRRNSVVTRLTFDKGTDSDAIFSPDAKAIVFFSNREPAGLYQKAVGGGKSEELIAATGFSSWPRDWSADGRNILYDKAGDIWLLPLSSPATASSIIHDTGAQVMGHFSPDGKKIAYASDESGRPEIFVQDFPISGAKWQVSSAGGTEPRWRPDGRELYFLAANGELTAVDVADTAKFKLGIPHALFQTHLMELGSGSLRRFSVTDNGQRFLMNVAAEDTHDKPMTIVVNWQRLLDPK